MKIRMYPRDCFACGKPMELIDGPLPMAFCRQCEVEEDATISGRWKRPSLEPCVWGGMIIPFIDHGTEHVPSPG